VFEPLFPAPFPLVVVIGLAVRRFPGFALEPSRGQSADQSLGWYPGIGFPYRMEIPKRQPPGRELPGWKFRQIH
jgi:hypothetical protein